MTRTGTIGILLVASALEACGDAIVRIGLQTNPMLHRLALFCVAAMILFAYGWTVNAPRWDFGTLLGLYVVFFFLIAQLLSWLVFNQPPSTAILLGGSFIIAGGVIISLAKA